MLRLFVLIVLAFGVQSKEFPCNNGDANFLFYIDNSGNLTADEYSAEASFLLSYVFKPWTRFKNLAIGYYAGTLETSAFGSFYNIDDLRKYMNKHNRLDDKDLLFCKLFKELSDNNYSNLHLFIFISEFNEVIVEDCLDATKKISGKVNFIGLISLRTDSKVENLLEFVSNAKILNWQSGTGEMPPDWEDYFWTQYGCTGKAPNKYPPCDQKLIVGYDVSNSSLSGENFEQQATFLTEDVFIPFTHFEQLVLFSYATGLKESRKFGDLHSYPAIRTYINKHQQIKADASLCSAFSEIKENSLLASSSNVLLFSSKIDEQLNVTCSDVYQYLLTQTMTLTVVNMEPNIEDSMIKSLFVGCVVIPWYITSQTNPLDWDKNNLLAYGCDIPQTTIVSTTTPFTSTNPPRKYLLYIEIFVPLLVIILVAVLLFLLWRYRHKKQKREEDLNALANRSIPKLEDNCFAAEDPWLLSAENVQVNYVNKLGSGAFGCVYSGRLIGDSAVKRIYASPLLQKFSDCPIAVKTLPIFNEWTRNEFQQEIDFMKTLKFHQNIVCFLGYVDDYEKPLLILELCSKGNLLSFIREHKQSFQTSNENSLEVKDLILFAWQISSGLEYLSSLGLIHRDVAARNVLLNSNLICKISDFGLTRIPDDQMLVYMSSGGKSPIRWNAIETLKNLEYSTKSDVWSYAVLLFELFSLGDLPYAGLDNILMFLESGKRLQQPRFCPDEIYEMMLTCWQVMPENRHNFSYIEQHLKEIIEESSSNYNYICAVNNIKVDV